MYGSAIVLTGLVDSDGKYIFDNLLSGSYQVSVLTNTIPSVFEAYASNAGTIN
jgi:hypothetical protein